LASVKYEVYAHQNAQFLAFGSHSFPSSPGTHEIPSLDSSRSGGDSPATGRATPTRQDIVSPEVKPADAAQPQQREKVVPEPAQKKENPAPSPGAEEIPTEKGGPAPNPNSSEENQDRNNDPNPTEPPAKEPKKTDHSGENPTEDIPGSETQHSEDIYSLDNPDGPATWKRDFDDMMWRIEKNHGLPTNGSQIHLIECAIGNPEYEKLVCLNAEDILRKLNMENPNSPRIAWILAQCAENSCDTSLVEKLLSVIISGRNVLQCIHGWMTDNSLDDAVKELRELVLKLPCPTLIPLLTRNKDPKWEAFVADVLHRVASANAGEISADLQYELLNVMRGVNRDKYTQGLLENYPPSNGAKLVIILMRAPFGGGCMFLRLIASVPAARLWSILDPHIDSKAAISLLESCPDGCMQNFLNVLGINTQHDTHELLMYLMEKALTGGADIANQLAQMLLAQKYTLKFTAKVPVCNKAVDRHGFALRMFRLLATLGESTALFANGKNCKKIRLPGTICALLEAVIASGSTTGEAFATFFEIAQKVDPKYNLPFGVYGSLAKKPTVRTAFLKGVGEIYHKLSPEAKVVLRPATGDDSDEWNKSIDQIQKSSPPVGS
jgi:hypothetical protein